MKSRKGYSLTELLTALVIIGVISTIATSNLLTNIHKHTVQNDIMQVEQAIKLARSNAVKTSSIIEADFTKATTNNGDDGGIIEIKKSDGAVLTSVALSKNVQLNSTGSTIANKKIIFDFRGQPIDSTGDTDGFTDSNNKVTISYYRNSSPVFSKSLSVKPMIGDINNNN